MMAFAGVLKRNGERNGDEETKNEIIVRIR